jgi:hypothetical protein
MGAIEPKIRMPAHAWPNPQPRFYPKSGVTHSPLNMSRSLLKTVWRSEPQAAGAHTSATTDSVIGMGAIEPNIGVPAHAWPNPQPRFYRKSGVTHWPPLKMRCRVLFFKTKQRFG